MQYDEPVYFLPPATVKRTPGTLAPRITGKRKPASPFGDLRVKWFIPIRSCQKFSKQICLWDLAQIIGILFIIQIVEAI